MPSDPVGGPIILLILLVLLYGRLSGTEAAIHALSEARLRLEAEEEDDPRAKRLLPLAEAPEETLSALQTFITLTALLCGALSAVVFAPQLAEALPDSFLTPAWRYALSAVIVILILALVMLTLAVALPRRLAERDPERIADRRLGGLRVLTACLRPFVRAVSGLTGGLLRLFGVAPAAPQEDVTEEDIRALVDMGGESGALEKNEQEMIENIFAFSDRLAEDVMIHRTDVTALPVDADRDEVVRTILDTGYSRFPVYGQDMDDILGILRTRDYLLSLHDAEPAPVRALLREAYFVPEHVTADQLFRDMQRRKVQMAVVVDEYGGMSGIVTMEDLLEEIVGDIYDETDAQDEAEIVKLSDNLWRIAGTAPVEEVAEALGADLPTEEDYDTLGGLIFSQFSAIPEDGSKPVLDVCGLHIQVEAIAEHRVETALVSLLAPPETPDTKEPGEAD